MRDPKSSVYALLREPDDEGHLVNNWVDKALMYFIILNALAFVLETVPSIYEKHQTAFDIFEYISIGVFGLEYILRLWTITCNRRYSHPIAGRIR